MTDITCFCITSTAETALKKLKKAEIGVYDCKKQGPKFIFSVKDKDSKKVFAIFANPCYNICVNKQSKRTRLKLAFINRIGAVVGLALFIAVAIISNSFVLGISVSGSGSFMDAQVREIVYEAGAKKFGLFKAFDLPYAQSRILSLPNVTFCNITKKGSVISVDIQVDEELSESASPLPLVSDRAGTVQIINVICGTAEVEKDGVVNEGDTLIGAYDADGAKCLAVGYVKLLCKGSEVYFAEEESEQSLKDAYASLNIEGVEIVQKTYRTEPCENGVNYIIDFTYLHTLYINMK